MTSDTRNNNEQLTDDQTQATDHTSIVRGLQNSNTRAYLSGDPIVDLTVKGAVRQSMRVSIDPSLNPIAEEM